MSVNQSPQAYIISNSEEGTRLDLWLAATKPEYSRSHWKKLLAAGIVQVNGRNADKSLLLRAGWTITIQAAPENPLPTTEHSLLSMNELEVVWRDKDMIAVNKPAGMPSHPIKTDETYSAWHGLCTLEPDFRSAGPKVLEGGLIHRLDVQTSGILLAALNRQTFDQLRDLFSKHDAVKDYLAIVIGDLAEDCDIELAIAHDAHDDRRMLALTPDDISRAEQSGTRSWRSHPRTAHSSIRVLQRLGPLTLVQVRVRQAQMHQIRVHLAAIGYPLAADAIYIDKKLRDRDCSGLTRHALHAWRISFPWPNKTNLLTVEAPLSKDMAAVLLQHGGEIDFLRDQSHRA